VLAALASAATLACPASPGPAAPIGTSHASRIDRDAATAQIEPAADAGTEPPVEDAPPSPAPVSAAPCMSVDDALAWAQGPGAQTVADALARDITDRRPSSAPEATGAEAAAWIRSVSAATLSDPACASLLVSFGPDPAAEGLAIFDPALTAPAVAFALCADGSSACSVIRSDDVDGDGRGELLVERSTLGSVVPPSFVLYEFLADADPAPVWVSDDDAVRCALFGDDGDSDPANQAEAGNVAFAFEGGVPTIRADYRLLACPVDGDAAAACEPTGAETLEFTRLGDVYLLPGEPEPGAPWGRPEYGGETP